MKSKRKFITVLLTIQVVACLLLLTGCGEKQIDTDFHDVGIGPTKATQRSYVIRGTRYYPIPSARGFKETGLASWYGGKFHGRKTANGETYNMHTMTAAHKTLPMGTILRVKSLENGREITVRINDRGPFVRGRIIDLSYVAAKRLNMIGIGVKKVKITTLSEHIAQINKNKRPVILSSGKKRAVMSAPLPDRQYPQTKTKTIYIKLQSFDNREEARILARRFTISGKDVIIQQFPAAGTYFFRVLVAGGNSINEATIYKNILVENGFTYAKVVRES
jgi:rare lipoprotein A